MSVFLRCLRAESYKLWRRKKYIVFLILVPAVYILRAALSLSLSGADDNVSNVFGALLQTGGNGITFGSYMLYFHLPLLAFMGVCDLFSSEFRQKSVRACLTRPVTRASLYFAKCVSVLIVCFISACAPAIADILFSLCAGIAPKGSYWQIAYLLIDMLPLFCLITFSALINMLVGSPSFSMLLSIALYIAALICGMIYGFSQSVFTGYIGWHTLFIGHWLPFTALITRVTVVFGALVCMSSFGALLFERKQF